MNIINTVTMVAYVLWTIVYTVSYAVGSFKEKNKVGGIFLIILTVISVISVIITGLINY